MSTDDDRIREMVARLSLAEKVGLLTGRDFWSTTPLPSIGLRSIVLSDGPSGVRGPVWDERDPSINLPSATALSSSWDVAVATRYGVVAAAEARRKGVDVVLGPTINLHRSPLGGRHFEAFSEDPVLTAALAAAYVSGVQGAGVAATPKHYVANDFETERFTASVEVDERALREVYLRAFEDAVVVARAWVVMSAYNAVNGVTASEHDLLETPLNSEWGFDGVVVSDWTAVRSIAAARASQDLAMPGPAGAWGDPLAAAVRAGEVAEAAIDRKVARILRLAARVGALEGTAPRDVPAGDDLGAAILSPSTRTAPARIEAGRTYALTYRFEYVPVPGGLEGLLATGIGLGPDSTAPERLLAGAESLARESDVVVLVVGTNSRVESEGRDRTTLRLPGRQEELARRVIAANPRTVVVVNSGSPVLLPAADDAAAVLLTWFGGQEYGTALGDILSDAEEPGGRLPTTWPRAFEDVPVANVTPENGRLAYDEGIHIGYRAWLRAGREPLYWFGQGEGYTTFAVGEPRVAPVADGFEVVVDVRNTGDRAGKHVIQVYAARPGTAIDRPVRWLAGFQAVRLGPGEAAAARVAVPRRAFAHWDDGWSYEPGEFDLVVARSAGDPGTVVRVTIQDDGR
ncbi:hypothetical protein GCM10010191_95270 [Actinomadura vinacea]|uniref:Fibronectin type III-like domain-containing protein n=1 Tax=Actinomadura vinacea TaxID=115336 RepID=A0ABP5XQU1_9ACTN